MASDRRWHRRLNGALAVHMASATAIAVSLVAIAAHAQAQTPPAKASPEIRPEVPRQAPLRFADLSVLSAIRQLLDGDELGLQHAVRQRRDAYFTARGASSLDPESLCALGRSEIAGGTPIGRLLTAK